MEFKNFREKLSRNFNNALGDKTLFEVQVDKDELWNLYLDSFPEGTNRIYRVRREYDCCHCRQFIRAIGGTVFIDENLKVHTIFEFDTGSQVFQPVADALDAYVKSKAITDVFLTDNRLVGVPQNRELTEDGTVKTWHHLTVVLPDQCLERRDNIGTMKGRLRDRRNVFKRSLDEITIDAMDIVLELISSNSLYKGEEWKNSIQTLKENKIKYDALSSEEKELYAWRTSMFVGDVLGKIRNHSIGVLLVDISEGMNLDDAVRRYENIVAPANYKRPKAIYTKKMLDDAKKTIEELGYMDSLPRRFATLDDITVNNILFSNKDSAKRISGADIFDEMSSDIAINPKRFSKVEEISIDSFIANVIPTAREIEVLLENKHSANMVSLIAPKNQGCKSMFKWNNNFSWAYSGNMTDSSMKQNVKAAGGDVTGDLRFSIQWNDGEDYNPNDFDAHCLEPSGNEIYFRNKGLRHRSSGMLDVDIINPTRNMPAVENITWSDKEKMPRGKYTFAVHCYRYSGGRSGFKAEIEFDGQIYAFAYNRSLKQNDMIVVAEVVWDGTKFEIHETLPASTSSREVWNLSTNQFVPVSVVCYSPNYWDEQDGVGHRHYFFMLKGCVNPENPNGFYNEFLKQELVEHKRVFEALGGRMAVEATDDQLSGLGFSSTRRNELIVKVKGTSERVLKIKF